MEVTGQAKTEPGFREAVPAPAHGSPGLLEAADRLLSSAETIFVGAALIFTSVLLFINVGLRYLFLWPLQWAEELTLYLMVWIVFIGGSIIVRTRGHIAVDVVPNFISGRANRRLKLAVTMVSFAFFVCLLYYSAQHTLRIRSSGQVMPAMQRPMWLAYLAMPVGSLLMGIRTLQVAVRIWTNPALGEKVELDLGD